MVMQSGGGQIGGTILVKVLMEGGTVPGAGSGSPPRPPGGGGRAPGGSGGGYGGDKKHQEQQGVMIDWLRKIGLGITMGGLLKQSKIASGILGAIWQILGALVDVLLMPLVPLLVRMVGRLAQLVPFIMKLFTDPKAAMKDAWDYFKGMVKAWFTGDVKKFLPDLLLAIVGFFAAKAVISKGIGGVARAGLGMMGMGGLAGGGRHGGMGGMGGCCPCCGPMGMGGMGTVGGGMYGRGGVGGAGMGPGMARTARLGRMASMGAMLPMMAGAILPIMMGTLAAGLVIKMLKVDELAAAIMVTPGTAKEEHERNQEEIKEEVDKVGQYLGAAGDMPIPTQEILADRKSFWHGAEGDVDEEGRYDPARWAATQAALDKAAQAYTDKQTSMGNVNFASYAGDVSALPRGTISQISAIEQGLNLAAPSQMATSSAFLSTGEMDTLTGIIGDFKDRYDEDWSADEEVKRHMIYNLEHMLEEKFIKGKDIDLSEGLQKSFGNVRNEQGDMVPLASLLMMQNMGGMSLQEVVVRLESGMDLVGNSNLRLTAEHNRSEEEKIAYDREQFRQFGVPGM